MGIFDQHIEPPIRPKVDMLLLGQGADKAQSLKDRPCCRSLGMGFNKKSPKNITEPAARISSAIQSYHRMVNKSVEIFSLRRLFR